MNTRTGAVILMLGFLFGLAGCYRGPSETNDPGNIEFGLHYAVSSPALAAAVSSHRVTVTTAADGDTIATQSKPDDLTSTVVFTLADLPADVPLVFTVEAIEGAGAAGTIIYSGSTEATIAAGRITQIAIEMVPQVALQRFDHRSLAVPGNQSQIKVTTEVYNLDPLYGISFMVSWADSTELQLDSAALDPGYNPNEVIFFERANHASSYSYSITHTLTGGNLAATTDPTSLASFYFTKLSGIGTGDTVNVQIQTTGYTETQADTIPLTGVYNDGVLLNIQP